MFAVIRAAALRTQVIAAFTLIFDSISVGLCSAASPWRHAVPSISRLEQSSCVWTSLTRLVPLIFLIGNWRRENRETIQPSSHASKRGFGAPSSAVTPYKKPVSLVDLLLFLFPHRIAYLYRPSSTFQALLHLKYSQFVPLQVTVPERLKGLAILYNCCPPFSPTSFARLTTLTGAANTPPLLSSQPIKSLSSNKTYILNFRPFLLSTVSNNGSCR